MPSCDVDSQCAWYKISVRSQSKFSYIRPEVYEPVICEVGVGMLVDAVRTRSKAINNKRNSIAPCGSIFCGRPARKNCEPETELLIVFQ